MFLIFPSLIIAEIERADAYKSRSSDRDRRIFLLVPCAMGGDYFILFLPPTLFLSGKARQPQTDLPSATMLLAVSASTGPPNVLVSAVRWCCCWWCVHDAENEEGME